MIEGASVDVDRINGFPRTVRDLFTARKYSVDYYQRENRDVAGLDPAFASQRRVLERHRA